MGLQVFIVVKLNEIFCVLLVLSYWYWYGFTGFYCRETKWNILCLIGTVRGNYIWSGLNLDARKFELALNDSHATWESCVRERCGMYNWGNPFLTSHSLNRIFKTNPNKRSLNRRYVRFISILGGRFPREHARWRIRFRILKSSLKTRSLLVRTDSNKFYLVSLVT